ncbi:MAG: hypothetical protein ACJAYI_001984, partial [Myxococcota bacterium]
MTGLRSEMAAAQRDTTPATGAYVLKFE